MTTAAPPGRANGQEPGPVVRTGAFGVAVDFVRRVGGKARSLGPVRVLLIALACLAAVAALRPQLLSSQDPNAINVTALLKGPSWHHLLGTNEQGSDVLARLIYGTRLDLFIAVGSVFIAGALGLPAGLLAGYRGRAVDQVLRSVAVSTLAFPVILFAILVVASFGASLTSLVAILGFLFLPQVFLVTRAQARAVRQREYITASVVTGLRPRRVLVRHVLPNVIGPVLVLIPQLMATAILAEAGLSYLGLGVQPPAITWGTILLDSKNYYHQQPFYAASAGLMVTAAAALLIFAGDVIGESLDSGRARVRRPAAARSLRSRAGAAAPHGVEPPGGQVDHTGAPDAPSNGNRAPLVSVEDLKVTYAAAGGSGRSVVRAVDGVSFEIGERECLALVGESGSGKSSIARALVRMVPAAGSFTLGGDSFFEMRGEVLRSARRSVQLIFQSPQGSIDPRQTAREVIAEPIEAHRLIEPALIAARVEQLMRLVGFDPALADRRARQLSGGQCQRLAIARCLAVGARLVICDEPTSALDVSVQAQIINLLKDLQEREGTSLLFISHNLAVVRQLSHRVAVLYQGRVVEMAPSAGLFAAPFHPYTHELINSVVTTRGNGHGPGGARGARSLSAAARSSGCSYAPRCPHSDERCWAEIPLPRPATGGHVVACHHWEQIALGTKPQPGRLGLPPSTGVAGATGLAGGSGDAPA